MFGAATTDRLARSGWKVTLVEAQTPGHERSGSGDHTRLIRCAHGDDDWHTASARRAMSLWRELDPTLMIDAGVAWLARTDDGWEAASERALTALGIPTERVDAADIFPDVRTDDLAFTLYEPEAGVLRAAAGTCVLVDRAVAHGATLTRARARPDGAAVVLDDGRRLEADRVVWACGAWLPALFDGLLTLRITQQDVFWFAAGPKWAMPGIPGWVDYDGAFYGHGADGQGVKVAPDAEGPPIDLDAAARVPRPEHEAAARAYLGHRFPALAGAPLTGGRVCQYELTADTRFIIAPHPEHDGRVWMMGGGSGHGFKHAPVLGELMEGWLSDAAAPEPMFSLGERTAGTKLRTAGALE